MGWVRIDQSVWKGYVYPPVFTSPGFVYKDGRLRFDRVAGDTTSGSYNLTYEGANPAPDKTLKIRITVEEYRSTASSYYQPAQFSNYQASPSYVVTKNAAAQESSGAVLSFAPRIVSDENYAGTWLPSYRSSIVVNNATSGDEHYVHLIEVWDPDQSGTPPPPSGGGGVTIQTRDNNASLIPKPSHPVAGGKPMDRIWYDALQKLASKTVSESRVVDIVQSQIPPPPDNATKIMPGAGIEVSGSQKDGYFVSLRQLINTEAGTALYKFTRDDFGRVEGTESADTDDLSEGASNLYHTTERAQDAVGAAIAAGAGDGVSLAYDDVANAINATNTDKGSVAVALHVAAVDPHPQYTAAAEAAAAAAQAAVDAIAATGIADYYVDSTGALRKRVASILGGYDAAWCEVAGGVYQDVAAAVPADTTGQAVSRIPVHTAGALVPDLTPLVSTRDVTGWTKAATTVTADTDAGHDGATLADKVSETATTAVHGINKSLTKVVGRRYRYTAIVKPAGRTKVRVYLSSTRGVDFDLTTKTVIASSVAYGEASDAGNGYVRLDVYSPAAATSEPAWLILLDASGASSYAGDGTSGVLVSSIEVSAAEADFVPFTTAGRPEYRGDCVRFNGTSHNLVGAIPPLTGATKATLVMAIRHTSPTGTGVIFETTNPVASSGGFGAYLNNGVAGAVGGGMGMNASAYLYNNAQSVAPPETYTVAITYDPSGATDDDKVRVRINGADVDESASGSASTGSITSAALGLYGSFLGSRAGTSLFAAFDMYAFALVKGELSAQDFLDLDATFKSRAAITASAPIAGNYTLTPASFSESAEPVNTGAYYRPSTFAATEFQTEATSLTVNLYNTIYSTYPTFTTVGVYVDGDYNQTIAPTSAGSTSHTITLPSGNKLVSLVGGLQSRPSTAAPPIGTFVVSVASDQPMQQAFRPATNRFLAYGDSIAVGGNATNPDQNGWVMRVRAAAYPASVALEGWGSRSLHEDCNTPELRKAFVNKLASYGPATIWLAIGTNDYALNKWSAVDFGTAYAAVLDDLHARLPNARIYCQTPLVRTTEAANTFGNTTGDYRAQIATAVSSRTAYATLIDGTAILTTGDLADGVHPTTAGHGKYGDYMIGVLGL